MTAHRDAKIMPRPATEPAPRAVAENPIAQSPDAPLFLRRIWVLLTCILIIGVIHFLQLARSFLMPVVLALLIAMTFRPLVHGLAKRGLPPWLSAGALAFVMALLGGLAGYLLSGPVAAWISDAPQLQIAFAGKIRGLFDQAKPLVQLTQTIQEAAAPGGADNAQKVVMTQPAWDSLLTAALYPAQYVVMFGTAVILALFLMASGNLFYEKLIRVMPTLADKKQALRLVHDVEREVSHYLLSLTAINLGVGVAVALLFLLLGIPHAHLWGLLAFALNYVPYAGPFSGITLAFMTAIVTFDSLVYALLAPLAYFCTVLIENQLVTPYVMSRRLEINAVAILLAVAFFAWLWGIAGIVVSVPILVTMRIFSLHFDGLQVLGEFLAASKDSSAGENDVEASPAQASKGAVTGGPQS